MSNPCTPVLLALKEWREARLALFAAPNEPARWARLAEAEHALMAAAVGFEPTTNAGIKIQCLEPLGDAARKTWFASPLDLRQRFWRETNYGQRMSFEEWCHRGDSNPCPSA